jgi:hypothetical protein
MSNDTNNNFPHVGGPVQILEEKRILTHRLARAHHAAIGAIALMID